MRVDTSARRRTLGIVSILGFALIAWTACSVEGLAQANKEFDANIQKYLEIHKKAVAAVPPLGKEVEDPAEISKHEQQVAAEIRKLRPNAKQGEIFTPAVKTMIVSSIKKVVDGKDGAAARATILGEGNPKSAVEPGTPVPLAVNAVYSTTAPLSTVPPSVLTILPTLPKELEFRFVGRNLILRDTQANIIVDFITNAL